MGIPKTPWQDRFVAKVAIADGCWEWTAGKDYKGYGRFGFDSQRRHSLAHRVAYELWVGPIPEGLCVLHRCDNPACCRPDHLFVGTKQDNTRDMDQKGRRPKLDHKGSANGNSKLTPEQILAIRADQRRPKEIAAEYGIDRTYVWGIKVRRKWKHL